MALGVAKKFSVSTLACFNASFLAVTEHKPLLCPESAAAAVRRDRDLSNGMSLTF